MKSNGSSLTEVVNLSMRIRDSNAMRPPSRASSCIMVPVLVAFVAACAGISGSPGMAVDAADLGHAERFMRTCRLMPPAVDRVAMSIIVGGQDRVVRAIGGCGKEWGTAADPFGEHPLETIEIWDYFADSIESTDLEWWGICGVSPLTVVYSAERGTFAVRLGRGLLAWSHSASLIRAVVARVIDGSDSALLKAGQDLSVSWGSDELVVLNRSMGGGGDLCEPSSSSPSVDRFAVQKHSAAGKFEIIVRGNPAVESGTGVAQFIGASGEKSRASVEEDGRYVLEIDFKRDTSFDAESALRLAFMYLADVAR